MKNYANPTRKGQKSQGVRKAFGLKRSLLPMPQKYYSDTAQLKLSSHGIWRSAVCPFHDDTSPSLRINFEKGAFCCMACGAKGGDVLAFHMKLRGLSFIQAAKDLGAWEAIK